MTTYPIALLNTSILTNDGKYELSSITLDEARYLVEDTALDSAIGHDSTAQILTELLGVAVSVNRQQFSQQVHQLALVFKLNGRPAEGQILDRAQIESIGYSFKLLKRTA